MSPVATRFGRHAVDLLVLAVAFILAFVIRFEGDIAPQMLKRMLFLTPYVVLWQFSVMVVMGIPRFPWRYIGMREGIRIGLAMLAASALFVAIRLTLSVVDTSWGGFQYAKIPYGVIVIDFMLSLIGLMAIRGLWRVIVERRARRRRGNQQDLSAERTLLVGAGSAGVLVAKEIQGRPDLGIIPVAFVDERMTSVRAEHAVLAAGLDRSKGRQKGRVDAAAAQLIIQAWLDNPAIAR